MPSKVAWLRREDPVLGLSGEVKKPETINYRTFKPRRDGLFVPKFFGLSRTTNACAANTSLETPWRDLRKCGVEVTQTKVRHRAVDTLIWLPCAHIWFLKSLPSVWAWCWT
jgi:DNA-directed RNA polymerase subunit beta'